jgi:hypothetical protein
MANLSYKNSTMKDMQHGGQYGNTAIWDAKIPVGGAIGLTSNTGDVVTVDLMRLPAGTTVCEVSFVNTAYSANSKIDVGFKYEDTTQTIPVGSATPSSTAFIAAQDVSVAASGLKPIMPMHFSIPAVVQVKFSGATGEQIKKTIGELYLRLLGKSDGA